jgi:hypothetical protein
MGTLGRASRSGLVGASGLRASEAVGWEMGWASARRFRRVTGLTSEVDKS